jgi:multidrug efflux pump subunit AcrA (membrane-fusion protein)
MPRLPALMFVGALALAPPACKPKDAEGGPADPRAQAVAVETLVLQERPVRDTSEYLATLSSRSSVTLFPQVIGHVSAILVKPGDRVKAGAALVQIDPSQQQATLEQLVAAKRLKEARVPGTSIAITLSLILRVPYSETSVAFDRRFCYICL